MIETKEIIICPACEGYGTIHNHRDDGPTYFTCARCEGKGRIVKVTKQEFRLLSNGTTGGKHYCIEFDREEKL